MKFISWYWYGGGAAFSEASPVLNLSGTEVKWGCKKEYDAPRLTQSPTLQDGAEGPGREAASTAAEDGQEGAWTGTGRKPSSGPGRRPGPPLCGRKRRGRAVPTIAHCAFECVRVGHWLAG